MLNITIVLVDCVTILLVFDYPKFQELLFNTLQSSWYKSRLLRKMHLSFLHDGLSI